MQCLKDFDGLTSSHLNDAQGKADELLKKAAALAGFSSIEGYKKLLFNKTVCITMLAGAGTRWLESLRHIDSLPAGYTPEMPRALYPVKNHTAYEPQYAAIGIYALAALKGLGRHLLVVRGWEKEIVTAILEPLGLVEKDYSFARQQEFAGKPRGHGDAAWQAIESWKSAEYIIVNFGGDASSPHTAFRALAVMDALSAQGIKPSLLLPVAPMESPPYPVAVDESGLPIAFGHRKLMNTLGAPTRGAALESSKSMKGYSNIGLRVYRAGDLALVLEEMARLYRQADGLWNIPGNDPESGEFALDNADAVFARWQKARVLAIGRAEEITPVKALQDLPAFEKAVSGLWKS